MSDLDLRAAQRRYKETKSEADAEALLRAMGRVGKLPDVIDLMGRFKRMEDVVTLVVQVLNESVAVPRTLLVSLNRTLREGRRAILPSEVLDWIERRDKPPEPPPPPRFFRAGDRVHRTIMDRYGRRMQGVMDVLEFDQEGENVPVRGPQGEIVMIPSVQFDLDAPGTDEARETILRSTADGLGYEVQGLARRQLARLLTEKEKEGR